MHTLATQLTVGHPLFVAQRLVVIIRGSHEISLEIFTRLKMTTRRRRFWSVPLNSIYSTIYNDGPDSKLVKKGLKCGQKWGRFYCHCLHHCHGRQLSMDGVMMDARTLFCCVGETFFGTPHSACAILPILASFLKYSLVAAKSKLLSF